MTTLSNPFLHFEIDRERFSWQVVSDTFPEISLRGITSLTSYWSGIRGEKLSTLAALQPGMRITGPLERSSLQGDLQQIIVESGRDPQGLSSVWTFALAQDLPLFLWKTAIHNHSKQPVHLERFVMLEAGAKANLRMHPLEDMPGEPGFFSNGWQSWSSTGAYGREDKARRSRLGILQKPMVINPSTPETDQIGHFTSDFFGILGDRTHRRGILAGFLSQKEQFGSVEAWLQKNLRLRMWAAGDGARIDPGGSMETDWAALQFVDLDHPDPLDGYLRAAARENQVGDLPPAPVGWCSWYHYYTHLSAKDVEQNLDAILDLRPDLPLDLVQIDDGFETLAGDWFNFKPAFQGGVAPLAKKISEAGLTPGLWLAPFILHPQARVVRQHPDWLLRDRWGIPVTAGFVWNRLTYALDLSVPAALDYACSVVKTATEVWGFPYLKLDFLYAGALAGKRRDETLTRAQVLRQACEAIRRSVGPETTLLGCGVPLGTALGLFEAVRIGADVSGDWAPAFLNHKRFFDPEPGMPSARNAIQNILTRATLHQRWWVNDPDCLLVRPDTHLSLPEVQTLATTIGMTGGSLLVSDDLPALPVERIRIAQVLLPPIDRRPVILDWFDSPTPTRLRLDLSDPDGHGWSLLAWFNWTEETVTVNLHLAEYGLDPEKEYLASSFWTEECQTTRDGRLGPFSVPAHGVLLLRTTQKPAQARPAYVGSDLHLSQGFEMTGFEAEGRQVRVRLELPRKAEGVIRLALPFEPVKASQDGSPVAWKPMGEEIYQFQVKFDRTARLEVTGS